MPSGPVLTVIVPVYNLVPHVRDCLASLVSQETDFPFEILVGDDGSTDGSREICEEFAIRHPERVRLLPPAPNRGLVGNLKRLMAEVRGTHLGYIDGDDLALPGKFAIQHRYLDEHAGCSICYHESEMFESASGARIRDYSKGYYNWKYVPRRATLEHLVRYGTFLQAGSVMFRAHPHLVKLIEERCRIIADFPMAVMTAGFLGGSIDFIDRTLGRYRVHGGSFTSANARSPVRRLEAMEDIVTACRLGRRFGLSEAIVSAGVGHAVYAAALYFLRRREDVLFQELIERSAEGGFRFDERHEIAWQIRDQPEAVRAVLFPEGVGRE